LVVIATEPEFGEIGKRVVVRDQIRRQMAVIVVDGLALRIAVIKLASLFRTEEEVVVNEGAGSHEGGDGTGGSKRRANRGIQSVRSWNQKRQPGSCRTVRDARRESD